MAKSKTIKFHLKCPECGSLNYTTSKNPVENKDKLALRKFCKTCRASTVHKETKISKAKK